MKLIHFSPEHLRLQAPLPFGLRDASGRLLLGAGASIAHPDQLEHLSSLPLFADEHEANEWRRHLGAAVGSMLRQNATLKTIAELRPADTHDTATHEASVPEQWDSLVSLLDLALRQDCSGSDLLTRVAQVHERALRLGQRALDASLYHLIYTAAQSHQRYSSHHALLVMLVCDQAAQLLGWTPAQVASLGRAALSMNVAMAALQDHLAASDTLLTPAMREQIRDHAARSADTLQAAGLDDALWLEAVRLHHDRGDVQARLADLSEGQRLARLLRRTDIFTAKISRRRTREPMSPVQAAREACLGSDGVPDEVGGALLRATGLYPPGSWVELANGERGIVVARGRRANLPWVASLVSPSGMALGEPALRDTLEARFAVRSAVAAAQMKVRPDHARILALR